MGARLARRAEPEAGSEAGAATGCGPAPYERRVRWLREIQSTLRERRPERARQLLRLLRQAREGAGGQGLEAGEGPGAAGFGLRTRRGPGGSPDPRRARGPSWFRGEDITGCRGGSLVWARGQGREGSQLE